MTNKDFRLELVRKLMNSLKPKVVKLELGSIKRLDENTIVEKTTDGVIILYEVSS